MLYPLLSESSFSSSMLLVLRDKRPVTPPPVWLMRQAGRYLPGYYELRNQAENFISLCLNPVLAKQITLLPFRYFDLDGAIIFSDILLIPYALGQHIWFTEAGPQREALEIGSETWHKIMEPNVNLWKNRLEPVYEAIVAVKNNLPRGAALIGFAGAPWTLACYMLHDGGEKHNWTGVKQKFLEYPNEMKQLFDVLEELIVQHLHYQVLAGCEVVQLFDSWAGAWGLPHLADFVFAPTSRIVSKFKQLHPEVPVIGFPRMISSLQATYAHATNVDAISIDMATNHLLLQQQLQGKIVIQGGLDPEILQIGGSGLRQQAEFLLNNYQNYPYIFNLSHGVLKNTPYKHVQDLLNIIRRE